MQHRSLLAAVALSLTVALPALPAAGQSVSNPQMSIDSPREGTTVGNGSLVDIGGWAADPAGPGTGVDAVRVYLDGQMDAGGRLLGEATYGSPRPDVAQALGSVALTNTGFNYLWTPLDLSTGSHTLYVYARSTSGAWFSRSVAITARSSSVQTQPGGSYQGPGGYPGGYGPGAGMMPPPAYPGGGYGYGYGPPMYPGYPGYGGYPGYPGGGSGRVCIMIYPPPPGC
jgi:hypothetical protein